MPARNSSRTWKIITGILLLLAAVMAIIIIHWAVKSKTKGCFHDNNIHFMKVKAPDTRAAKLFSDLAPEEIITVKEYMFDQKELNLLPITQAAVNSNYIFLIELFNPPKEDVLYYLASNGSKPERVARVVVFQGAHKSPVVQEYLVGPLPKPICYRKRNYSNRHYSILYSSRPNSFPEGTHLRNIISEIGDKLYHVFKESYGYWMNNCSTNCLVAVDFSPKGFKPGDRETWFMFFKIHVGFYLRVTDFEILIDHRSTNVREWRVKKLFYHGQYFDSIEQLLEGYGNGKIQKVTYSGKTNKNLIYSTFQRRGTFQANTKQRGPLEFEPDGHRFQLYGNLVQYMPWTFAIRVRSSTGLQIFDIRFNGERIAYELSFQEAIAFYGGNTPATMQNKAVDSGWLFGSSTFEMIKGVDCPKHAVFIDLHHFIDTDEVLHFPSSLCVFEHNAAIPLRRHYSGYNKKVSFHGGVENHVLVVRTIHTVHNYDYIIDVLFYQNGVIETKVSATGYLHVSGFVGEGKKYGTVVWDNVLGNVHAHLYNFKLDMDLAGAQNSFMTVSREFENISHPWSPGRWLIQPWVHRRVVNHEGEAAFRHGTTLPYLVFYNPKKENRWGHSRGYRLQLNSHTQPILPEGYGEEKGVTWNRYKVAVTKYKETETISSSMYNQNNPWDPVVYFDDFLNDNENIENKDLVAWITTGFVHVPSTEDIPATATPGNSVGFFFRPFNFFDEDPSLASPDGVVVRPDQGKTR
uniref:diamine oxidase [copper-containing]-like n=1 Tax=Myxine glutinosa TaxID=7769 RepID=UPI00358F3159